MTAQIPAVLLILAAVVGGWMVQLYLTYQQSVRFNAAVVRLKRSGTVTVGVGGNRYRGGRAFVAVALDVPAPDGGKSEQDAAVRDAIVLSGVTTLAGAKPLPALVGHTARRLAGVGDIDGLTPPQRIAARQAVELLLSRHDRAATGTEPAAAA